MIVTSVGSVHRGVQVHVSSGWAWPAGLGKKVAWAYTAQHSVMQGQQSVHMLCRDRAARECHLATSIW